MSRTHHQAVSDPPGTAEAHRCDGCQRRPRHPGERADIATVWILPGPTGPHTGHFCRDCAPAGPVIDLTCTRCGDGPLLAGDIADRPDQATPLLITAGWQLAGPPTCPSCPPFTADLPTHARRTGPRTRNRTVVRPRERQLDYAAPGSAAGGKPNKADDPPPAAEPPAAPPTSPSRSSELDHRDDGARGPAPSRRTPQHPTAASRPAATVPSYCRAVAASGAAVVTSTVTRAVDEHDLAGLAVAAAQPVGPSEAHKVGEARNGDGAQMRDLAAVGRAVVKMRSPIVQGDPWTTRSFSKERIDRVTACLNLLVSKAVAEPRSP